MIVVRIELWPQGNATRKRELAAISIANVGGDAKIAEYEYRVSHQIDSVHGAEWEGLEAFAFTGKGVWKSGRIERFARSRGVVKLLAAVLRGARL